MKRQCWCVGTESFPTRPETAPELRPALTRNLVYIHLHVCRQYQPVASLHNVMQPFVVALAPAQANVSPRATFTKCHYDELARLSANKNCFNVYFTIYFLTSFHCMWTS
jgi:hypothetical protein